MLQVGSVMQILLNFSTAFDIHGIFLDRLAGVHFTGFTPVSLSGTIGWYRHIVAHRGSYLLYFLRPCSVPHAIQDLFETT